MLKASGWRRISRRAYSLLKAQKRVHKYIRRVPYTSKHGKPRYRYYYNETSHRIGKLDRGDHLKVGSAFKLTHNGKLGHFEIKAVDGDKLTVYHSETKTKTTITRAALLKMIQDEHGEAHEAARGAMRDKAKARLKAARKHGSAAHIRRAEAHAKKWGVQAKPRTVYLVSCSNGKSLDEGSTDKVAAKDLYNSDLFNKTRRHAEANGDAWYILSAKHGLVDPEEKLGHYNLSLNDLGAGGRREWGKRVLKEIKATIPDGSNLVVMAGRKYRDPLMEGLKDQGHAVEVPMEGLGIGSMKAWLNREHAKRGAWTSGKDSSTGKGARILSLFSGVGGLDLGLHRALPDAELVGLVEQNEYAQKVLKKQFKGVPVHSDVRDVARAAKAGTLDAVPNIVVGGFPCQDLSNVNRSAAGLAGHKSGLYYEMEAIVQATDPDWVLYENVTGLRTKGLEHLLSAHKEMGYEIAWDGVHAHAVGAPHRRDRVFVVGHRPGVHFEFTAPKEEEGAPVLREHWEAEVPPMRVAGEHKAPRHQRDQEIRGAGNAVVPQVGEHLGRLMGDSRPGARKLSKKQVFARWHEERQRWEDKKGRSVTKWPRAGVMRGDVVYKVPTAVPLRKKAIRHVRAGDRVWVRPSPSQAAVSMSSEFTPEESRVLDALKNGHTLPGGFEDEIEVLRGKSPQSNMPEKITFHFLVYA